DFWAPMPGRASYHIAAFRSLGPHGIRQDEAGVLARSRCSLEPGVEARRRELLYRMRVECPIRGPVRDLVRDLERLRAVRMLELRAIPVELAVGVCVAVLEKAHDEPLLLVK